MNLRNVFALLLSAILPASVTGCHSHAMFDDGGLTAVKAASGPVHITRMGGGIDVSDAPQGANLSTMGGEIHVGNVAGFAKVKTMGGGIEILHSTGSVEAVSMGGSITIHTADGPIKASSMGGDIKVREVGSSSDKRDIELSSKGGTIELTVPKDFPMDVRITLAYTKNADHEYRIVQHAGLETHETNEWDHSLGSPRKYIRATGRVGNGQNRVTIDTVNGDVVLRQE